MTKSEWLTCEDPKRMLRYVSTKKKVSDRKLRLIAIACCYTDPKKGYRIKKPKEIYETVVRFVDGTATQADVLRHWPATQFKGSWPGRPYVWASDFASTAMLSTDERLENGSNDYPTAPQVVAHVRDICGNPFDKTKFSKAWRTDTAVALARQMYEAREFSAMPILADALQDAGCDWEDALTHCRDANVTHVRGCWVVDLVLGRE